MLPVNVTEFGAQEGWYKEGRSLRGPTLEAACGPQEWCSGHVDEDSTNVGTGLSWMKMHGSLCSSTTTSVHVEDIGDMKDINVYFKDLMHFQGTLFTEIEHVKLIFGTTDEDLDFYLGTIKTATKDLVDTAKNVVTNYCLTAKHIRYDVLPSLKHAKRHATVTILGGAQHWLTSMKKAAKDVRRMYVHLLERVRYMLQCTDLVLTDLFTLSMDGEPPSETLAASTAAARSNLSSMEVAVLHLRSIERTLEDCSDFWLVLHSTERTLTWMEDKAQQLRIKMINGGNKNKELPGQFSAFCSILEQLCTRYYCTTLAWEMPPEMQYNAGTVTEF